MPSARVGNSGGPPMTKSFANRGQVGDGRQVILAAVAWVTVIESLSSADEELRISSELGSLAFSAA